MRLQTRHAAPMGSGGAWRPLPGGGARARLHPQLELQLALVLAQPRAVGLAPGERGRAVVPAQRLQHAARARVDVRVHQLLPPPASRASGPPGEPSQRRPPLPGRRACIRVLRAWPASSWGVAFVSTCGECSMLNASAAPSRLPSRLHAKRTGRRGGGAARHVLGGANRSSGPCGSVKPCNASRQPRFMRRRGAPRCPPRARAPWRSSCGRSAAGAPPGGGPCGGGSSRWRGP
jgi:hypothetical protein